MVLLLLLNKRLLLLLKLKLLLLVKLKLLLLLKLKLLFCGGCFSSYVLLRSFNPLVQPVAARRIQFLGCRPKTYVANSGVCSGLSPPVDASSPEKYRHFAVDQGRDIVYFCDVDPKDQRAGLKCFASKRNGEQKDIDRETNEQDQIERQKVVYIYFFFLALPSFVKRLVGFHPLSAQMLLEGAGGEIYYSEDGELAVKAPNPALAVDSTVQAAKSLPGLTRTLVGSKPWGKYTGI